MSVGAGNHDGKQVGHRGEAGGLHRLRGHRGVTQSGQSAGRRRRADDRRRIAEIERATGSGVHAHVCHEAGHHKVRGVCGLQHLVEVRVHERVRIVLHHHRLAVVRGHPRHDRAALPLDVVQRAGAVVVLDVDDRDARRTRPVEQRGGLVERLLHALEFHHSARVRVLAVDQDQCRFGQADRPLRQIGQDAQGRVAHAPERTVLTQKRLQSVPAPRIARTHRR